MARIVGTEVVKKQPWRRDDRHEEADAERHHEERHNEEEDEDGERRAHQEPDEGDSGHLDGAGGISGYDAHQRCVLLESVGG